MSDNDNGFIRQFLKIVCFIMLVVVVVFICAATSWIPFVGTLICVLTIGVVTSRAQNICESVVDYVIGYPEDNDEDGDLSTIRNQTLPVAYLSTATLYCHFFEHVGRLPSGTCPVAATLGDDPMQRSIGGGVIGLTGSVTIANNSDTKTISANGTFIMDKFVAAGMPYSVTIVTQPAGQTCAVGNSSGAVNSRDIRNIGISCATAGDVTPPGAIANLTVTTGNIGMCANFLSWQNPTDPDFFGGVIVRNGDHVPTTISDGETIYNGDIPSDNNQVPEGNFSFPTSFTDNRVDPGILYYYGIFARDTAVPTNHGAPATGSVRTDSACSINPSCGSSCGGGGGGTPCFIATASFGESHNLLRSS